MAGLALLLIFAACGEESPDTGTGPGAEPTVATDGGDCEEGEVTTDTGLKIEDIECGDGAEATAGSLVTVHYEGTLEDGTKFDASRDHGQPFSFQLGGGQVIAGWDEGVEGMKIGGTRKLTIPPELGYGASGSPPVIPPNATLLFTIEMIDVQSGG